MAIRMSDKLPPQTALSQWEIAIFDHLSKDSIREKKELIRVYFEGRKTWWLSLYNSRSTTGEIGMRLVGN